MSSHARSGSGTRRVWIALGVVVFGSLAVLGYFGHEIYLQAPPVPNRVVTTNGRVLWTNADIKDGQNVWQSIGGQEVGTVWGHGAYVAPDWSADWLHREAIFILDRWAEAAHGTAYAALDPETKAALRERLAVELRHNTYDPASGDLVVSADRAAAIAAVSAHYAALFGDAPALAKERDAYAIPPDTVKTPERQNELNTTPLHGHAALFGVYGMLGIGLMLFCMRLLTARRTWRTKALAVAFWGVNVGLALMCLLSLLPVGLMQTWASVSHGMWYARSAEFSQTSAMNTFRWLRVIGDTVFSVGVLALAWFIAGLATGWSLEKRPGEPPSPAPTAPAR